MSDFDALDERLRAVERALTDGDSDLTGLRDAAELTREVERLADRLDDAEDRLDELDAATQALRGYVGNVRAVNESVERRADAALAKAEELEADRGTTDPPWGTDPRAAEDADRAPRSRRPCDCARRRSDRATDADDESGSRTDGAGPLARLASGLLGVE